MNLIFFLVSLLSSVIGAICGIGGGIIIKPTLDLFGLASVSTVSFLSGCTVLSMCCYSVAKGAVSRSDKIELRLSVPLALGSALGGVAGKQLFQLLTGGSHGNVLAAQSLCLCIITIAVFVYTLFKARLKNFRITNKAVCVIIGFSLGLLSAFLGIGGGPINLAVLFFFFSMDIKKAAQNSLFIILFSQSASLITTLITRSVPEFNPVTLLLMVAGGLLGGIVGQFLKKKISPRLNEKLFLILCAVITLISFMNIFK